MKRPRKPRMPGATITDGKIEFPPIVFPASRRPETREELNARANKLFQRKLDQYGRFILAYQKWLLATQGPGGFSPHVLRELGWKGEV